MENKITTTYSPFLLERKLHQVVLYLMESYQGRVLQLEEENDNTDDPLI